MLAFFAYLDLSLSKTKPEGEPSGTCTDDDNRYTFHLDRYSRGHRPLQMKGEYVVLLRWRVSEDTDLPLPVLSLLEMIRRTFRRGQ
jgi:hypothetical protein